MLTSPTKYNPRFDGLRCIAICAVMLLHFTPFLGRRISSGFYGVNLFFVLSGFLITSILLQQSDTTKGRQYFNFLGRRALRIFPIYYLALFIVYVTNTPNIHERIFYLISYSYNYVLPDVDWHKDYTINFWSLCVEEQFYLLFPVVVLFARRNPRWLLVFCTTCVFVAWGQVFFNTLGIDGTARRVYIFNYVSLVTNMAPLMLGAIAAILHYKNTVPKLLYSFGAELLALTLTLYALIFLSYKYQMVICSLASTVLVLKAWTHGFSFAFIEKLIMNRYVRYIGRISYGIYIYHIIVRNYMDAYVIGPLRTSIGLNGWNNIEWLNHPGLFRLVTCTVLVLLMAHLSYEYIEKPLLSLKDKLFPYCRAGSAESFSTIRSKPAVVSEPL
jgi:peptidoglycan/LPS O-acetylase OafA/YrhL